MTGFEFFLLFSNLSEWAHCLLACKLSDEKSANIIEDPLYALNSFSHSAFKISLSLTFDSLITCLPVGLSEFSWNFFSFFLFLW